MYLGLAIRKLFENLNGKHILTRITLDLLSSVEPVFRSSVVIVMAMI